MLECFVIEDNGHTLICEVTIRGEKKTIPFYWSDHYHYFRSEELIYVQIPAGGTQRSYGFSDSLYNNKVRTAFMFIQKIKGQYHWITVYKIMDGEGRIASWVDSEWGKRLKHLEALDSVTPYAIWVEETPQ